MSGTADEPVNPWIPQEKLLVPVASKTSETPAATGSAQPGEPPGNTTLVAWYATDRQRVDSLPEHRRIPVWTTSVNPHLGGMSPSRNQAGWWWLGVHGGSGLSSLQRFLPGGADAHRWWPDPAFGGPNAVILVCRTHLSGLERARDAAAQWAAADVPAGLLLAGAVAVADAPGRLERPQLEALRMLDGIVPRLWTVPWIDDLRCLGPGETLPLPPALLTLRADLATLRSSASTRPERRE